MHDPGLRNQIFLPMEKNDKGLMDVNGKFITVNDMIDCDSSWTEEVHHDLNSYVRYLLYHI
jgi:hypothetical protein